MSCSDEFVNYVLEQLSGLPGLHSRRMFGGLGLYGDGVFFGLIAGDVVYFKVGEENRGDYERRAMPAFRPYPDKPEVSMTYFEVPADVLEDRESCVEWAVRSIAVSSQPGRPRPSRSRLVRRARRRGADAP